MSLSLPNNHEDWLTWISSWQAPLRKVAACMAEVSFGVEDRAMGIFVRL